MMILRQTVHMIIHILLMTIQIMIHHIQAVHHQVVRLMMILIVTIVHRIVVVHLAVAVRQVPLNITAMLVDVQKREQKLLQDYQVIQNIIVKNIMMRCKVL